MIQLKNLIFLLTTSTFLLLRIIFNLLILILAINLATFSNITGNDYLAYLNARNNSLTKLNISPPQLNYLDVSKNYLKELDLSIIANLQTLNCSNNPNLANLTLPNNFKPSVLDCRNTSLKNITFSNFSIFDCETGKIISGNTTSTTTSIPTTSFVATSQPNPNNLGLNLGLGLGIPLAIIVVGLTAFFGYKWKKSRTPEFQVGGSR